MSKRGEKNKFFILDTPRLLLYNTLGKTNFLKGKRKMKKLLALLLVLILAFSCFACFPSTQPDNGDENGGEGGNGDGVTVMTHAEYTAAPLESEVVIEAYVQATQSWWDNKITVYLQDEDGAYFAYEMTCTEEESEALVVGQKIRVTGYKSAWADEVEIVDCTFEVLDGNWVAEPTDLTDKLGTDALIHYQNQLASFKGMTVKEISIHQPYIIFCCRLIVIISFILISIIR